MLVIKNNVQSLIDSSLALLREEYSFGGTEKTELTIQVGTILEMHLIYAYFLETYGKEIEMFENEPLFQEFVFKENENTYMYSFKIYKDICVSICREDTDLVLDGEMLNSCFILDLRGINTFTGGIYGV